MVERDEYETTGLRAVLNYGHTFAHGFETLAGYGTLLHGEAVAIGMMCAAKLARRMNLIDADFVERQTALLETLGLPTSPRSPQYPTDDLIAVMRRDKKAVGGKMRFILPTRLGEVKLFDDVSESLVRAVLEGCDDLLRRGWVDYPCRGLWILACRLFGRAVVARLGGTWSG